MELGTLIAVLRTDATGRYLIQANNIMVLLNKAVIPFGGVQ